MSSTFAKNGASILELHSDKRDENPCLVLCKALLLSRIQTMQAIAILTQNRKMIRSHFPGKCENLELFYEARCNFEACSLGEAGRLVAEALAMYHPFAGKDQSKTNERNFDGIKARLSPLTSKNNAYVSSDLFKAGEFGRQARSLDEIWLRYGNGFGSERRVPLHSPQYSKVQFNQEMSTNVATSSQVGGVQGCSSIEALNSFFSQSREIYGVSICQSTKSLMLIGRQQNKLSTKEVINVFDFSAAILMVYEDPFTPVSFSLDPLDPLRPDGETLRKVYWPESYLQYSTIGSAMFEADWFLKVLLYDIDGQAKKYSLPNYQPLIDLRFKASNAFTIERNRLWFVCKLATKRVNDSSYATQFILEPDDIEVSVSARSQEIDAKSRSGLKDSENQSLSPEMSTFIRWCNANIKVLCQKIPELMRLKQVFAAIEVARFCRDSNVNLDLEAFRGFYESKSQEISRHETFTVPAFRKTYTRGFTSLSVHGGVCFENSKRSSGVASKGEEDATILLTAEQKSILTYLQEQLSHGSKSSKNKNSHSLQSQSFYKTPDGELISIAIPILGTVVDQCQACQTAVLPEQAHFVVQRSKDQLLWHASCGNCFICGSERDKLGRCILGDNNQLLCSQDCANTLSSFDSLDRALLQGGGGGGGSGQNKIDPSIAIKNLDANAVMERVNKQLSSVTSKGQLLSYDQVLNLQCKVLVAEVVSELSRYLERSSSPLYAPTKAIAGVMKSLFPSSHRSAAMPAKAEDNDYEEELKLALAASMSESKSREAAKGSVKAASDCGQEDEELSLAIAMSLKESEKKQRPQQQQQQQQQIAASANSVDESQLLRAFFTSEPLRGGDEKSLSSNSSKPSLHLETSEDEQLALALSLSLQDHHH